MYSGHFWGKTTYFSSLPLPHLVPGFTQPGHDHQPRFLESQVVHFHAFCLLWQGLPLLWPSPFLPVKPRLPIFPFRGEGFSTLGSWTQKVGFPPPLYPYIYSKNVSHNTLGQEINPRVPLVNHDVLFAARLTID